MSTTKRRGSLRVGTGAALGGAMVAAGVGAVSLWPVRPVAAVLLSVVAYWVLLVIVYRWRVGVEEPGQDRLRRIRRMVGALAVLGCALSLLLVAYVA